MVPLRTANLPSLTEESNNTGTSEAAACSITKHYMLTNKKSQFNKHIQIMYSSFTHFRTINPSQLSV